MANVDTAIIHRDRDLLERMLRQAGAVFKGKAINCLWHPDVHPSGSIYQNEQGEWRFKCHSCGVVKDVLDVQAFMQNKTVDEVLKEMATDEPAPPPPRVFASIEAMIESVSKFCTVEDHYRYTNPDTKIVEMVVLRCRDSEGKKSFIQAKPAPGGYVQRAPAKPWPLFNRTAVRASGTVLIVEGEKCVKSLREAGWTATTSPAGAGNADKADWTPLAGKRLIFWRDFDDNGQKYINAAIEACQKLSPAPKIFIVDVTKLEIPEKGDCVDYLYNWGSEEDRDYNFKLIKTVVDGAAGTGPSAKVDKLIADTISGKRYAVAWPWERLGNLTHALLPGTAMAICGDPAASKSFMLLQAARFWHLHEVPFALYQLESDEEGSHLLRAIVQKTGHYDLLNWEWIRDNGDEAERIKAENRDFVDSFGANLWTPPASTVSLADLTDWVRDRAKEGRRVIAIDPITAADTGKQRWDDDRHFVLNCQKITRDAGASLIIVTHPKLSAKTGGLADLAGGAAFTRFTQTVIWIKAFHPYKEFVVEASFGGRTPAMANRTIRITKARLGRGTGMELAYKFGNGMLFEEIGVVEKAAKNSSMDDAV